MGDKVIGELKGKAVDDVMAEGMSKLSSMPAGGVAVAASGGGGGGGAAAEVAKEEEKKEESEEETDDDLGFSLLTSSPVSTYQNSFSTKPNIHFKLYRFHVLRVDGCFPASSVSSKQLLTFKVTLVTH